MGMQNFIAPDLDLLKATHFTVCDDKDGSSANDSPAGEFEGIIGTSQTFQKVLELLRVVAPTDSTVLILGETGTGKELIAQALHRNSPRSEGPFVKLNCSAIPADLLESELFGHEKGAFTGAISQKVGRFEVADTGTLFLDEIGDMPLALQPKVLRLLQEQEFERLGSCRTRRINVRLIAATNRDLDEMIGRNEFRTDLYYRLNVFPIVLPPLRERPEDIASLVAHFARNFANRLGKRLDRIPQETMDALTAYAWPGNVRELQNLVERAVILCHNGVLSNPLSMLRAKHLTSAPTVSIPVGPLATPATFMDSQRAIILQALDRTEWAIGGPHGAAAYLGLKRTTLISKMKKLGICRPSKLAARAASAGSQA
ncbi:MAG TPA: sigma 54-interacting transcriptional regulator [Pyrinomonadaceae bacterium]|jgi:formate hydrogenlyase transcriptional activator|nr:sigma 54-interacting transcriptional regulator [Pyrinomonadaceae bacterium]